MGLMLLIPAMYTPIFLCLAVDIPPPTGNYDVGIHSYVVPFIDRSNPIWPGNVSTSYLATTYYPTLRTPDEPVTQYMDPEAVPILEVLFNQTAGTLSKITTHLKPNASIAQPPQDNCFPSLVFQPGLGAISEMYTILLAELASYGYTVTALDFPYDAGFVRYPNGTGVTGVFNNASWVDPNTVDELLEALYDYRVRAGTHFVDSWPALVEQLKAPFHTTRLGVLGHSFGGAASVGMAGAIPDVVSALNLDGTLFGKPASNISSVANIKKPVLLVGETVQLGRIDPTWDTFQTTQTGWWRILLVAGADHLDFTDAPLWRELDGQIGKSTIDLARMMNITRDFVTAFFNQTILNQTELILSQPETVWPEVTVLAKGNGSLSL
ncbi:alpha/beta-hydrolase [Stipitochalara longipes BDJ]|nr:alpha/beta-hydrolase [Stipitochalara longipes BDJ]